MPPKKAAKKLHELAAEVKVGHKITDTKKKTYVVGKQFATGGFGRIHICTEEGKSTQLVMKIEPADNGPLFSEVIVFQKILKAEQIEAYKKKNKISWIGLPNIISAGIFTYVNDKMRFMIIPKYATSLESIRESSNGKLAMKNVLEISLSMLNSLEYVHEMDYTHADIKAANILLEKLGDFKTSVLVDFGLARYSAKIEDKPDKKRAHNGTCIFTSIDAHRGCNPSFRGDIEILAYNIIYWLTGTLPWAHLETEPEKTYEAKKKFVDGLPATLKTSLQDHSHAVDFVSLLFNASVKTGYTAKVDFSKLKKLAESTLSKAPTDSAKSKKAKPSSTPKRGARRAAAAPVEEAETEEDETGSDDDDDDEQPQEASPSPPKRTKPKVAKTNIVATRSKLKESANARKASKRLSSTSFSGNESIISGNLTMSPSCSSPRRGGALSAARKIEQKYRRKSLVKSALRPVAVTSSPIKKNAISSDGEDAVENIEERRKIGGKDRTSGTIVLKTAAAPRKPGTTRSRSGMTLAVKASPTKLRGVPGMLNFPKGRRTIFIKETAARYAKELEDTD